VLSWLSDPNAWLALLTLSALEVVLGIDNIIFISILAGKLPRPKQPKARQLGLIGAFFTRVAFLLSITWVMRLVRPLFSLGGHGVTGKDLILVVGGLFLIGKAVHEIHGKLASARNDSEEAEEHRRAASSLVGVVAQIMVIDIVFSIDSVITAVGMASDVMIMIAANVVALGFMLFAAGPISNFVDRHPTVKILALAFLVMIGVNLIIDGFGFHLSKGYIYTAMIFSVIVESINIRMRTMAARAAVLRAQLDEGAEDVAPPSAV
jgi:predicted tellurium resistance membrane protein TerC